MNPAEFDLRDEIKDAILVSNEHVSECECTCDEL